MDDTNPLDFKAYSLHLEIHEFKWIDGLAGLLGGVSLFLTLDWLVEWYNISRETLVIIGVANLAYGTYSLSIATLKKRPEILIVILVMANLAWALNCVRMAITFGNTASIFGLIHLLGEAIFVGGLAWLEWRYRKDLKI
jgi:hypothetical protein